MSPVGAPTGTPANASATPPLGSLPTGGLALAQMMHAERFPGQPLPSPAELHSAVDDLSADGLLHPFLADQLHAGANAPDRHVAANIADRVATSRGLPSILDPQMQGLNNAQAMFSQASGEVASLMGQQAAPSLAGAAVPNGATNGRPAIANLPRWQSAARTYQQHATSMATLAPKAAEKQAIATIAAEPTATGKVGIRDAYLQVNPGADRSRFTAQLMSGV